MTTLGNGKREVKLRGHRVAPQSFMSIEGLAIELAPGIPTLPGHPFQVDAWRLLEKAMTRAGYDFRVLDDSEMVDCAGYTVPDERLIALRQDVYDGLFTGSCFSASTAVHEVAHIALQHHVTLHRGAQLGNHPVFEDAEWQANSLTSAVMMPRLACSRVGNVEDLMELCGVSYSAALVRLFKLMDKRLITLSPSVEAEIRETIEKRKKPQRR